MRVIDVQPQIVFSPDGVWDLHVAKDRLPTEPSHGDETEQHLAGIRDIAGVSLAVEGLRTGIQIRASGNELLASETGDSLRSFSEGIDKVLPEYEDETGNAYIPSKIDQVVELTSVEGRNGSRDRRLIVGKYFHGWLQIPDALSSDVAFNTIVALALPHVKQGRSAIEAKFEYEPDADGKGTQVGSALGFEVRSQEADFLVGDSEDASQLDVITGHRLSIILPTSNHDRAGWGISKSTPHMSPAASKSPRSYSEELIGIESYRQFASILKAVGTLTHAATPDIPRINDLPK